MANYWLYVENSVKIVKVKSKFDINTDINEEK